MSSNDMEKIIQLYGDDVYRFCFHLAGSREEAIDVTGDDTFYFGNDVDGLNDDEGLL